MKKILVVLVSVSAMVFAFAIGAFAGSGYSVSVKIPFPFYAGDRLIPAGQYLFEMPTVGNSATGSLLTIRTKDGSVCQHMHTHRVEGDTADTDYHLIFNKYGESYFLTKVLNSDLGAELFRSDTEKKATLAYSTDLRATKVVLKPVHSKGK